MLKEGNFEGCLTEVEGKTHSSLWRPIDLMPEVSEYDILKDNDALKYIKYIPKFRADSYKSFNVELYQLSYPHWKHLCQSSADGKVLGPNQVIAITEDARAVKVWA